MPASAARKPRTAPTVENHLSLAAPPVVWLRWTAFRYQLPRNRSRLRVPVWRALRNLHALNLQSGLWAVPQTDNEGVDLAPVVRLIEGAGGSTSTTVVGSAEIDDIEQHVGLWRACERVWDDFFTDLDRLTIRVSAGAGSVAAHHEDLQRLREEFGTLLARDLVGSDGSTRAAVRLERVADGLGDRVDPDAGASGRNRVIVSETAGWSLDNGNARHVLVLRPTPTASWDRSLREFEATVYAPTSRPSIRHGAVSLTCAGRELEAVAGSVRDRVANFERYISD